MPTRTLEGDALEEMKATLNEGISSQTEPVAFGEAMSSANFVTSQLVRNAISRGEGNYSKVSTITVAVTSHISTQLTQEKRTQKFNEFVLILHNLRLDNLAQQLVEKLREKRPSYESPLGSSGTNPTPSRPPLRGPTPGGPTPGGPPPGASQGAAQQFSTSMEVDELHSWLLSNKLSPQDCKLIKDRNINGMAFKYIPEADWEKFGLSYGGLVILKEFILKQISAPSPGPSRAANGSTSNGGLRNGSSNGAQNGVSSQRNGTHSSSRTLIKSYHYGRLCEQLRPCAAKWQNIAQSLGFEANEIENIKADPTKLINPPGSYMDCIIDKWSHWAPSDARGSNDYAMLEALRDAVNKAGFSDIAPNLTIAD